MFSESVPELADGAGRGAAFKLACSLHSISTASTEEQAVRPIITCWNECATPPLGPSEAGGDGGREEGIAIRIPRIPSNDISLHNTHVNCWPSFTYPGLSSFAAWSAPGATTSLVNHTCLLFPTDLFLPTLVRSNFGIQNLRLLMGR